MKLKWNYFILFLMTACVGNDVSKFSPSICSKLINDNPIVKKHYEEITIDSSTIQTLIDPSYAIPKNYFAYKFKILVRKKLKPHIDTLTCISLVSKGDDKDYRFYCADDPGIFTIGFFAPFFDNKPSDLKKYCNNLLNIIVPDFGSNGFQLMKTTEMNKFIFVNKLNFNKQVYVDSVIFYTNGYKILSIGTSKHYPQ